MEDNICWNTTFDGRRPLVEEDLQWMTTFDGRRPSLERFRDSALPYTAVAVIFSDIFGFGTYFLQTLILTLSIFF